MRLFELRRDDKVVAEGVVFGNGRAALNWLTDVPSTTIYPSLEGLIKVHGHNGKIVQIARVEEPVVRHLFNNMLQDEAENVAVSFITGSAKYMWDEREKLARCFEQQVLND